LHRPLSAPAKQAPVTAPGVGAPGAPPLQDLHGDPLPDGAVLRLGTLQRRAVGAALAFQANGQSFVSVRGGRFLRVWDAATGRLRETHELRAGEDAYSEWDQATLSPDGRWLVQDVQWDAHYLWDLRTGKHVCPLPGLRQTSGGSGDGERHVAFSPDGNQVAAV